MEQQQTVQTSAPEALVARAHPSTAAASQLAPALRGNGVGSFVEQMRDAQHRSALEAAALRNRAAGRPTSDACERLKKYRAADSESRRQPFEAEGEVFLRRLSGAAAERVRLQIAMKWPNGVLDIRQNERALRDFTLSVLAVCVYSQPNLAVPYFANLEEAAEWVDALDPELQQLAFAWREAAVKLNPLLLPPATILSTIPEPRTPEDEAEDAAHLAELLKDVPSRSISEAAETPVEEAPATV